MPLSSRCLPLSPSIPFCFLMSGAASSLVVSSYSCIFLCLVYSDSTVTLLAVHPYALLLHLFIFIEHCCFVVDSPPIGRLVGLLKKIASDRDHLSVFCCYNPTCCFCVHLSSSC
jgi:hypothetical protein